MMSFLERIHVETNPPIDSVAFIIPVTGTLRNPGIIVAERLEGFRKGQLSFFGGGVEPGERPIRGAKREAWEEAGVRFRESDLIPAQRNPSAERWGCSFHNVYMYWAYVDRRRMKPQRKESKLGEWQVFTLPQIVDAVRDMRLPRFVLNGWWYQTLQDTRYDKLS